MAEKYVKVENDRGPVEGIDPDLWLDTMRETYRRAGSEYKKPENEGFTPWVVNGD